MHEVMSLSIASSTKRIDKKHVLMQHQNTRTSLLLTCLLKPLRYSAISFSDDAGDGIAGSKTRHHITILHISHEPR